MHRDTKVGLALGVLLVGVVAAFFFRHDDSVPSEVPRLANPAAIDASISERDVVPYLAETDVHVPASEAMEPDQQWRLPDFLQDDTPMSIAGEPFPGGTRSPDRSPTTSGDSVIVDESGGRTYVVQSGDTLSGIASRVLGSSARFEELYEANRDVLESPDRLRLGQRLRIPDGRRPVERLAADPPRDEVVATPASTRRVVPEPTLEEESETDESDGPETIRVEELDRENESTSQVRRFVPVRRSPYTGSRRPIRNESIAGP